MTGVLKVCVPSVLSFLPETHVGVDIRWVGIGPFLILLVEGWNFEAQLVRQRSGSLEGSLSQGRLPGQHVSLAHAGQSLGYRRAILSMMSFSMGQGLAIKFGGFRPGLKQAGAISKSSPFVGRVGLLLQCSG